jgi:hypothetical protein
MKRRVRKIVNFFAFNLLFFALYLNFIHKDNAATAVVVTDTNSSANTAAFSGTVLVENPDQYLKKNEVAIPTVHQTTTVENKTEQPASQPLRLSIN